MMGDLIEALILCSTSEHYDAYPAQFPVNFRGFGSESIGQMALHSQFTLIGHKETRPHNAPSCLSLQLLRSYSSYLIFIHYLSTFDMCISNVGM